MVTHLPGSGDALLTQADTTRKNSDPNHLTDEVFEDLSTDAQELKTITHQVVASAIADFADSVEHKDESDGDGESGCGSQLLAPLTSGTGLELSGSDEWMLL